MIEFSSALLMFISARHAETRIHDAVRAAGYEDLSPAMARICSQVAEEGSRVTELAERAQITKQSASALVEQLERAGYVTRVQDGTDARAKLVTLAARGRQRSASRGARRRRSSASGPPPRRGPDAGTPRGAGRAETDHRPLPTEPPADFA